MNISKLQRLNIKFRIESLQEYNSFIEENIENELSSIQKKFDKAQIQYEKYLKDNPEQNEDDDYMIDYFDDLSYSSTKIQDSIILKHRNSILFLIYSLVEGELYSHAKHNTLQKNVFSIDDLSGNSIFEKFKIYTSKINSTLYKSIHDEIIFFDRIRLVRNFITHHNNVIRSNNSHLNKIKEFSKDKFELKEIGFVYQTDIITYVITLNNKKFINEVFLRLNILFDKIYLEN